MAIGASGADIRSQFLAEAVLLAAAGGVAGLLLGLGTGLGAAFLLDMAVVFQGTAIVAALLGAVGTGIAFGYAPASRAASLDPVQALAHE